MMVLRMVMVTLIMVMMVIMMVLRMVMMTMMMMMVLRMVIMTMLTILMVLTLMTMMMIMMTMMKIVRTVMSSKRVQENDDVALITYKKLTLHPPLPSRCVPHLPKLSNCALRRYGVLPSAPDNFRFSNVGTNTGLLHWEPPKK